MSNVVAFPTKASVEALWDKFVVMCGQLEARPELADDAAFAAEMAEAEAEWQQQYKRWAGRP